MIKQYVGNIFTHDGQSTVKGFAKELPPVKSALLSVSPTLTVIYGYHGDDPTGNWIRNFDDAEKKEAAKIAALFKNASLVLRVQPGMNNSEIQNAVAKGNVFFTWCDSDTRVKTAMGGKMPKSV